MNSLNLIRLAKLRLGYTHRLRCFECTDFGAYPEGAREKKEGEKCVFLSRAAAARRREYTFLLYSNFLGIRIHFFHHSKPSEQVRTGGASDPFKCIPLGDGNKEVRV